MNRENKFWNLGNFFMQHPNMMLSHPFMPRFTTWQFMAEIEYWLRFHPLYFHAYHCLSIFPIYSPIRESVSVCVSLLFFQTIFFLLVWCFFCQSTHLPVCLSVCLNVCQSSCSPNRPFACLAFCLSVHPFICVSVSISIQLCITGSSISTGKKY